MVDSAKGYLQGCPGGSTLTAESHRSLGFCSHHSHLPVRCGKESGSPLCFCTRNPPLMLDHVTLGSSSTNPFYAASKKSRCQTDTSESLSSLLFFFSLYFLNNVRMPVHDYRVSVPLYSFLDLPSPTLSGVHSVLAGFVL